MIMNNFCGIALAIQDNLVLLLIILFLELAAIAALVVFFLKAKKGEATQENDVKEEKVEEAPAEEAPVEEAPAEEKTRKVLGKYEVFKDCDFYKYTLKASNGEVLVESELYTTLDGVYNAIEAVKNNVLEGEISVTKDKMDNYQFKLSAKNHRVIAVSANYTTERAAVSASESFKRFAIDSNIVELDPSEVVSTISPIEIGEVENKQGGKIIITNEDEDSYFFVLYASNNEIMCTSLEYKSKNGAIQGIETFIGAIKEGKFYVIKDKNDNYQFKLYSSANRLVAVGQSYKTKQQAKESARIVVSYIENVNVEN